MTQYARPASVLSRGTWTDQADGTTDIFQAIDEVSPSDADYVKSVLAPSSAPVVFGLSSVGDPLSSANHVLSVRYKKDPAGGPQINLTVELRQGYASEGSQGTLIATRTYNNIADTWTTTQITLTGGEADTITDYSALALRLVATQV